MRRHLIWSWIAPQATWQLIVISMFLFLVAVASVFGIYDGLVKGDVGESGQSFVRLIFYGIPAYGLLRLRYWAWGFEIGLSVFLVLLGIYIGVTYHFFTGIILIILHGIIGGYLISRRCRNLFRKV